MKVGGGSIPANINSKIADHRGKKHPWLELLAFTGMSPTLLPEFPRAVGMMPRYR